MITDSVRRSQGLRARRYMNNRGRLALRIALLEDDLDQAALFTEWLKASGHSCEHFAAGKPFIRNIKHDSYDVLMLDWMVPDMDGYACARRLREEGLKVAILAFTASSIPGTRQACLDAGMDGHISKPVLRATLFNEIRRALKDRSGPGRRSRPGR